MTRADDEKLQDRGGAEADVLMPDAETKPLRKRKIDPIKAWLLRALFAGAVLMLLLVAFAAKFDSLQTEVTIEQANVARSLAGGQGLSSPSVQPLSFALVPEHPERVLYTAPAYPVILAGAMRVLGESDRIIGLVALIFLMLTIVLTYLVARRMFDERTAVGAVAVMVLTVPLLQHVWGLIALALGALLFAGGMWGRFASVLTLSLVLVIWGLIAWMGGIELGRRLLFPVGYLAFLVPAPSLLDRLSLPLRLFATKVSALLPMALGMNVRVEGTEMIVDNFRTMIDTPCSGLSYMLALLAAALLVAYLSECSLGRKIWLSLSAIPIAVLANIVRIEMTFLLHETVGDVFSAGFGHFLVGMVVIAFATLSLLGVWTFTCRESTDAS